MEQSIQTQTNDTSLIVLESHLRECFGRVVYSHKAHEKSADLRQRQGTSLKHGQIVLSALATGTIIIVIFGDPSVSKVSAVITAILSTILLVINTMTKDIDYGKMAEQHKTAASKLWDIRERYLSLLADIRARVVTSDFVRQKRDELQKELGAIYSESPRTTNKGYLEAQKGLKVNEELTFSDEEIDCFLPKPLKKTSNETNS